MQGARHGQSQATDRGALGDGWYDPLKNLFTVRMNLTVGPARNLLDALRSAADGSEARLRMLLVDPKPRPLPEHVWYDVLAVYA